MRDCDSEEAIAWHGFGALTGSDWPGWSGPGECSSAVNYYALTKVRSLRMA